MAGFIFKVYTEVEINLQRGYVTKILFNFNTAGTSMLNGSLKKIHILWLFRI